MAGAFEKALNNYLFNVEYGYAPKKKTNCKKKLLSLSKDEYWEDWKTIRQKDNLVEMETLNKNYNKKSLRDKLMERIENFDSWLPKINISMKNIEGIISYVANAIDFSNNLGDSIEYKTVDIPYYCTNTDKKTGKTVYAKIGTYTASKYVVREERMKAELLYVTQFEKKLYDLEEVLRKKLGFSKPTDYHYTSTLYFTYSGGLNKVYRNKNLERVYTNYVNRDERKWIDEDFSKRKKFYYDLAKLGGWAPMARWKNTFRDDLEYWLNKIVNETDKNTKGEHKKTIIKAFDDKLVAAGWEITFNGIKKGGKKYIKDELDKMKDISLKQRHMIYGLIKFDYKTVKMVVSGKQQLKL